MHFPFVREYQSEPHSERHAQQPNAELLRRTVTHFRHHYSAECSKFVVDTIFHALTRETNQVEINKTYVCHPEMLCITAGRGSVRKVVGGHLSC